MNRDLLLTFQEIQQLTGFKTPAAQKNWLRDRGWTFVVDRFGRPHVSRAYAELRLGVTAAAEAPVAPNWNGFAARRK